VKPSAKRSSASSTATVFEGHEREKEQGSQLARSQDQRPAPIVPHPRLRVHCSVPKRHDEFDRCSMHVRADGARALFGCLASYPRGSSGAPTLEDWPTNSRNLRVIYSSGAGTLRATDGFLGQHAAPVEPSAAIDFSSLREPLNGTVRSSVLVRGRSPGRARLEVSRGDFSQ
jgi:hypothetical protein